MLKKFLQNISGSLCIYIACLSNLITAIRKKSCNPLLWVSFGLSVLSLVLNLVSAFMEDEDAEA